MTPTQIAPRVPYAWSPAGRVPYMKKAPEPMLRGFTCRAALSGPPQDTRYFTAKTGRGLADSQTSFTVMRGTEASLGPARPTGQPT